MGLTRLVRGRSTAEIRQAGEDLARVVAERGSLAAAEAEGLPPPPDRAQLAAQARLGKMTPLQIGFIELIGGSPDFKPGTKTQLWTDGKVLEVRGGFKTVTYHLTHISAASETQRSIESRVTATRLLAVGVLAFAFKKRSLQTNQYLTVTSTDPTRSALLVFDTDNAPKLAAKIQAAARPYQIASSEPAGSDAGSDHAADIPDQLRQLADLQASGIISPEQFESKKAELLSRM
jgi:hypothetical protein